MSTSEHDAVGYFTSFRRKKAGEKTACTGPFIPKVILVCGDGFELATDFVLPRIQTKFETGEECRDFVRRMYAIVEPQLEYRGERPPMDE